MIPKIIFQTSKERPKNYLIYMIKHLSKDWTYIHFTDEDIVNFFKNNYWFSKTNRKMLDQMANHGVAIRQIMNEVGVDVVEDFIDTCLSIENLIDIIKAPDFPTAGIIYGIAGVREGYRTGRGRVVMRARTHFETVTNGRNEREAIVIDELPYQV